MNFPIKATALIGVSAFSLSMTPAFAGDEHSFQLKTRVIYFDRDYEKDSDDREQSALGIQLNYKSPQFNDLIGFGASGYFVEKISSSGRITNDVLTVTNGKTDGYGLLGQAYLKLTPTDQFSLKLGRQLHKSLLLTSSGSRAVPNTFRGLSAKYNPQKGLTIYAAVYDEWSNRAQSHFEGFQTDKSGIGSINYVGLIGAKYKTKKYAIQAEHLVSEDYLGKLGVKGTYNIPLEDSMLKLNSGVFASYDEGSLFVDGAEKGDVDSGTTSNDGLGAYIGLAWKKGNAELAANYAKFDGIWIEDNFKGDHGKNPFPTRSPLGPDLTNEGENVVSVHLKYDWRDQIPGLVTTLSTGYGWDAENSTDAALGSADEDWRTLDITYKPVAIKGLKFRSIWHDYDADEIGSVAGVKGGETDLRFYIDYAYNF